MFYGIMPKEGENKMTDQFIFDLIHKKELENPDFIRYTFYELKVKEDKNDDEVNKILRISRDYFENKGYKVYFTGARYEYKGALQNVQSNELMIAFKETGDE